MVPFKKFLSNFKPCIKIQLGQVLSSYRQDDMPLEAFLSHLLNAALSTTFVDFYTCFKVR